MLPEVTVLTAVRNGEKYISQTIESICKQSFSDFEYIIVDDHSSDRTVEIINRYRENDSRIKLIQHNKNIGPFAAANIGLDIAKGYYIIRTDGDDISFPNRIEKQVRFLKENPKIRACASFAQRIDHNSNLINNGIIKSLLTPGSIKWHLFLRCPLVHSTACIEKSVFEDMGGYNSSFTSQDYRMWCYLARRDIVAQLPEVLIYFRSNPDGISAKKEILQKNNGFEVAQDHIYNVTGQYWSRQTIEGLNAIGLVKKGFPIAQALRASRKWDSCWASDKTLSKNEFDALVTLSAELRKIFLKRNRREQFFDVLLNSSSYFFPSPKKTRY